MSDTPSSPSTPLKKKGSKKGKKSTRSSERHPKYGDFENEILTMIVKPRIDYLLNNGVSSINDLTQKFRDSFSSGVSLDTMKEWLSTLGYRLERPKVTLSILSPDQGKVSIPMPSVQPATPSSPQVLDGPDDPSVSFDNEKPSVPVSAPNGMSVATLRQMEAQGKVIDQPFRSIPI